MDSKIVDEKLECKNLGDRLVYGNCTHCYRYGFPCEIHDVQPHTEYKHADDINIMSFQQFVDIVDYEIDDDRILFYTFPHSYYYFLHSNDTHISNKDFEFIRQYRLENPQD